MSKLDNLQQYLRIRCRDLHEEYARIAREYSECRELLEYVKKINVHIDDQEEE